MFKLTWDETKRVFDDLMEFYWEYGPNRDMLPMLDRMRKNLLNVNHIFQWSDHQVVHIIKHNKEFGERISDTIIQLSSWSFYDKEDLENTLIKEFKEFAVNKSYSDFIDKYLPVTTSST